MKINEYLGNFKSGSINIVGPLWSHPTELEDPILFIDAGAKFKTNTGFSVGDNDSFSGQLDHILPQEKDYSDLAFALKACSDFSQLNLYGFLGGRKDHELINLGEVHYFLKNEKHKQANFDDEIFAYSQGQWNLNLSGTFSLFLFEDGNVSLNGACKYQLNSQKVKAFSSHGLSNIAAGEVAIKCDQPFFLFTNIVHGPLG